MYLFYQGENTIEITVIDENGSFVPDLEITYEIRKSSDDSLFDSGILSEGSSRYYKIINFTEAGQYNVFYGCPSGYESGMDTIMVSDSIALTQEEHNQLMAVALQNDLLNAINTINDNNVKIKTIEQINSGCWKMVNTQLIIYEDDNTTELFRFNLYDSSGKLTSDPIRVVERRRV